MTTSAPVFPFSRVSSIYPRSSHIAPDRFSTRLEPSRKPFRTLPSWYRTLQADRSDLGHARARALRSALVALLDNFLADNTKKRRLKLEGIVSHGEKLAKEYQGDVKKVLDDADAEM